jgi:hypothetical protein
MGEHIDTYVDETESTGDEQRTVNVAHTESYGTIGLPMFLSAAELEKQGIDLETTDKVVVQVQDGFVLIDSQ